MVLLRVKLNQSNHSGSLDGENLVSKKLLNTSREFNNRGKVGPLSGWLPRNWERGRGAVISFGAPRREEV